ncbi:hypothetical protein BBJ28_00014574 [Nothophytophthora sp. Chile5]|nr:hypothetical protein BBJ28_00014574 [Nothophytophthora sp. Chile5]
MCNRTGRVRGLRRGVSLSAAFAAFVLLLLLLCGGPAVPVSASAVWERAFPEAIARHQLPGERAAAASAAADGALPKTGEEAAASVAGSNYRYNTSTALYLAHITSVSYCQEQHIRNWSCQPCALVPPLQGVQVVEDAKDNFQGLVGYSQLYDAVVVAFRGSMDVTNWLDNLTFLKKRAYTQFPGVMVHEGFYWAYRSVASQVLTLVHKLQKLHPQASLLVSGHSLGGAVAAICAFELEYLEKIPVQALYTFGKPRVGNTNFSARLRNASMEVYRLTHFQDAVPHLPPTWTGFEHTTQEVGEAMSSVLLRRIDGLLFSVLLCRLLQIFYDEFSASYRNCSLTDGEDPSCSNACSPFSCTSITGPLALPPAFVGLRTTLHPLRKTPSHRLTALCGVRSPHTSMRKSPGLRLETSIVQDNVPVEIAAGLFVGSVHAAFNIEALKSNRISHVLNLAGNYATFPEDFTYLSLSIRDKEYASLLSCLPVAAVFIDAGLKQGRVLVHCAGGRSRSPAVAMAFLMMTQQLPYKAISTHVKALRPVVSLNAGFEAQLKCLESAQGDVFLAHQQLLESRLARLAQQYEGGGLEDELAKKRRQPQQQLNQPMPPPPPSKRQTSLDLLASGCDDRGMVGETVPSGFCLSLPSCAGSPEAAKGATPTSSFIPALRSMGTMFGCQSCGENLFCAGAIVRHSPTRQTDGDGDDGEVACFLDVLRGRKAAKAPPSGGTPDDTATKAAVDEKEGSDGIKQGFAKKPLLSKLRLRPHSPSLTMGSATREATSTSAKPGCETSALASGKFGQPQALQVLKAPRSPAVEGATRIVTAASSPGPPTSVGARRKSGGSIEGLWRSLTSFKTVKRTTKGAIDDLKAHGQLEIPTGGSKMQNPSSFGTDNPLPSTVGHAPAHLAFLKHNATAWQRSVKQLVRNGESATVGEAEGPMVEQMVALLEEDAKALAALSCCPQWFVDPQSWALDQAAKHSQGTIRCPREACSCGGGVTPAFAIKKEAVCVLGNLTSQSVELMDSPEH